jgi:hypothetical protein
MAVAEIKKPANAPCQHLCRKGCGIYATRPGACAGFECAWLAGALRVDERPDFSGIVVSLMLKSAFKGPTPGAYEVWQDASRSAVGQAIVNRLMRVYGRVVIFEANGMRRYKGPAGDLMDAYDARMPAPGPAGEPGQEPGPGAPVLVRDAETIIAAGDGLGQGNTGVPQKEKSEIPKEES